MKKRYTLLIALLLASTTMMAVPAKRISKTVRQGDGSMLTICLRGDESFHYYATEDGMALVESSDGSYYYGKAENGKMLSTGILAHDVDGRDLNEASFLNFASSALQSGVSDLWSERMRGRNVNRIERAIKNRSMFQSERKKSPQKANATKKGLVILVNYLDKKMASSTAQDDFNQQFNQVGYNKNKHIGSVRDYFTDQSEGQLTIDFDVVGPYELSDSMSYYGRNNARGDDMYAGKMVAEACRLANKDVNFKDYDWNGDGEVDQVYVIYAGYGEASGAPSTTIWPHEWDLESAKASGDGPGALTLDKVIINTYACSNELSGTSGSWMDGIGTACHEFSHCLGIPDFYDTEGKNFGMSYWSLMDYGCYNGPSGYGGNVPCAYTAYERYFAGWIEPTVLQYGCIVTDMKAITDEAESYIIFNEGHPDEYYMLFNIQKKSWNKYSKGNGMIVMHIDYDRNVWIDNTVNNVASRQRCTIIPADNKLSDNSLSGDPFPGSSNKDSLTNTSTPSAKLYNKNSDGTYLLNKSIESITEKNGKISFVFEKGKHIDDPVAIEATNVGTSAFTANWTGVEGATSYTVELKEPIDSELTKLLDEDFSGLSSLYNNTDVSETIDDYTQAKGWSGTNLSSTHEENVKLGKSTNPGSITTPKIRKAQSGKITVYITSHPYISSTPSNFTITYGSASTTIKCGRESKTFVFDVTNEDKSVTIATGDPTRAFIDRIVICDGEANVEQVEELLSSGSDSGVVTSTKSTLYTGLKYTSHLFSNLSQREYEYRVKAYNENDDLESKWSNWIKVVLEIPDAILQINDEIESKAAEIYTLGGIYMGSSLDTLSKGIYLVKRGKQVRKVMLRK